MTLAMSDVRFRTIGWGRRRISLSSAHFRANYPARLTQVVANESGI